MPPTDQQPDKPISPESDNSTLNADRARHQAKASWFFGTVLLLFILGVFAIGPKELEPWRQDMLRYICALLAGLFGFFIAGTVGVSSSAIKGIAFQAGGSVAFFVLVFVLWPSQSAPLPPANGSKFVGTWVGKNIPGEGALRENKEKKPTDITIHIPDPTSRNGEIHVIESGKDSNGVPYSNDERYELLNPLRIKNTLKNEILNLSEDGNRLNGENWRDSQIVYSTRDLRRVK